MRKTLWILASLIPLAGCSAPARSLQPLIPAQQAVEAPGLSGTWGEDETQTKEGAGEVWTFEEEKNHEYKLTVADPEAESSYVLKVRLARLGGYLFVDAILKEATIRGEKLDSDVFWIPIHYFGRIEVEQDEIHVGLLGDDWLEAALEDGRANLCHEKIEEGTLLTAATPELQEFAIRHGWDEEVFSYKVDLWRRAVAKP